MLVWQSPWSTRPAIHYTTASEKRLANIGRIILWLCVHGNTSLIGSAADNIRAYVFSADPFRFRWSICYICSSSHYHPIIAVVFSHGCVPGVVMMIIRRKMRDKTCKLWPTRIMLDIIIKAKLQSTNDRSSMNECFCLLRCHPWNIERDVGVLKQFDAHLNRSLNVFEYWILL